MFFFSFGWIKAKRSRQYMYGGHLFVLENDFHFQLFVVVSFLFTFLKGKVERQQPSLRELQNYRLRSGRLNLRDFVGNF